MTRAPGLSAAGWLSNIAGRVACGACSPPTGGGVMRSKTALMAMEVLVLLAASASAGVVMKVNGVPISAGQLSVAK